MYNSSAMTAAVRAMTSVGLSIWISALACLAGCGQILAGSRTIHHASAQLASAEMPDCHQSHSPAAPNEKKQNPTSVSCCLPDAVPQKTAADLNINASHANPSELAIDIADHSYAQAKNPARSLLHGGRQTLLQTHLLRI